MVKLSLTQQTAMDRFKEVKRLTGRSDWFTPYQMAANLGTCLALVRMNLLERCTNGRLYRLKVES